MIGRFSFVVLAIFLGIGCAASMMAQTPPAPIRVKVDLVSVAVRVTDKQGHDIQGLTAEDFTVAEDGQKQKIAFFDREKEPISMTVLVDSSSSMNFGGKTAAAQDMLDRVIGASRPEDEVSLLQFTDHVFGYREVTREQRMLSITTQVEKSTGGGTALYDAIASAFCHLGAAKNVRQAIVVITDGADQHSRLKLEELVRIVQASKAQLFMIGFYSLAEYEVYKRREKTVALVTGREIDNPVVVFERLATESGAESFFPTSNKALAQALQEISGILKEQYTLAYYSAANSKSFRRIQVKVNRGGVTIRARHGVSSMSAADESAQFEGSTCEVSAQQHPFPYETRLKQSGASQVYQEDFSDPHSGWPNRPGLRYTAKGYELSLDDATHRDNQILVNSGPLGAAVLAAYGPWWSEYHASLEVDGGWVKMHAPNTVRQPKRDEVLYGSSAGMAFRVDETGYYAFLLSTTTQSYEENALSYKLVKKTYGSNAEVQVVPWTPLAEKQVRLKFLGGIKLSVECVEEQIRLFIEEQEVGRVPDAGCSYGYVGLVSFGNGRGLFRNLVVKGKP
jgi:Ca-activated chloride channel family protein